MPQMDPITSVALIVVVGAVFFYALYLVVRAAVLSALRARDAELEAADGAATVRARVRTSRE